MFRPQIQKTYIMFLLALLVMFMVFVAVNSFEREPTYGFESKNNAVSIMERSLEILRNHFIFKNINSGKDTLSYGSFLLGPKESIIQTTKGSLQSKQSVLNLDFAAMITEMLIEIEIGEDEIVAVSFTGSYPGANIAVLSALEAMKIDAVIISSCGSSEYGATWPEFTWIDIDKFLYKQKIFSNTSTLASIGGGFDLGTQLNLDGKKKCESSIYNNKVELLNSINSNENIDKRMSHYSINQNQIGLFINVGGGVYSTGDSLKRLEIPAGIIYPGDISLDYRETVVEQFLNKDIPVLNINHIKTLTDWYELPYPPNKRYQNGIGALFYSKKEYNPMVILITFFISSGTVLMIGIISHKQIKTRMHSSESESLL